MFKKNIIDGTCILLKHSTFVLVWLFFFFQDSIFDVIRNIEYCDVVNDEDMIVEHLRLLVNLSVTNIAHDEIMTGAQEFFNILSQSLSGKIQVIELLLGGIFTVTFRLLVLYFRVIFRDLWINVYTIRHWFHCIHLFSFDHWALILLFYVVSLVK